jgi:lysozyme
MVTENAIKLIKKFEGYSSKAYKCKAGYWTIGYGNTHYTDDRPVKEGDIITPEQAEELFMQTLTQFSRQVYKLTPDLSFNKHDALTSLAYNIGIVAFKNSTLLKLVKANPNDKAIHPQFLRWRYIGTKSSKGLLKRRLLESKLYFHNQINPITFL